MYSSQHKQDRYTIFQIKFMGLTAEYPAISKLYPYNSGYVATRLRGYLEYPATSKLLPLAEPGSRVPQGFGFGLRLGLELGLGQFMNTSNLRRTSFQIMIHLILAGNEPSHGHLA